MLLTFKEIQRQVQAKIQNTNTSTTYDNDLLPKVKDWINDRYARIYRSFMFTECIDDYNLTLTASTTEYVFNRDVEPGGVVSIFDTTNGRVIEEDTIQKHNRHSAPHMDISSTILYDNPTHYRLTGVHTVQAETSQAETVSVVSSSASDISPHVVRVEGLVSGVRVGEEITLTGTTAANSTNTYDANQKLTVNTGTSDGTAKTIVGVISVTGTTSGDTLAKIAPDEYAHRYQWFKVSPTPRTSGTQPTWKIWYKKAFRRLDNDTDVPLFDCCIELVQGAFADSLREDGLEQEASAAEATFVNMVKELQSTRNTHNIMDQFIPGSASTRRVVYSEYDWV